MVQSRRHIEREAVCVCPGMFSLPSREAFEGGGGEQDLSNLNRAVCLVRECQRTVEYKTGLVVLVSAHRVWLALCEGVCKGVCAVSIRAVEG